MTRRDPFSLLGRAVAGFAAAVATATAALLLSSEVERWRFRRSLRHTRQTASVAAARAGAAPPTQVLRTAGTYETWLLRDLTDTQEHRS